MGMPSKLKNFNLFNDANSYQGLVAEMQLPKLARKMEAYRGGGMDGEVDVDLGQEKIELEWTIGGFDKIVYSQYGNVKADLALLRFNGAYQRDDTQEVTAVQVVVRGRHSELDPGTQKGGADSPTKVKTTCTYFKLTVDNEDLIEIDLLNFVFIVNGVDQLAKQRSAIGL